MEVRGISIAISLACVVVVHLLWSILNWVWFKPKKLERCLRQQGFQGNPYRLLYGDTNDKERMLLEARSKPLPHLSNHYLPRIHPLFHHIVGKYGTKCFMWNGPIPVVNIAEPELVREVFMRINEFVKPKANPFFKHISSGLVQIEGEVWVKRRKLLNPAFHMDKLKLMLPAFYESSSVMIKEWEEKVSETGSCEVDVWMYLQKLTADVISRAAFGSSYEEGKRIFKLIREEVKIAMPLIDSLYIPGWRFVPTKTNMKVEKIYQDIRNLLKDIIQKRKKAIKEEEKLKDDLLGLLLNSSLQENEHGIHGNTKESYTKLNLEEVIDECKIFYLAGQESTSSLLSWTLMLLGIHQDWQVRAREEVLNMFGNQVPDFHQLNHLKTVNMILQEVLRLYPPVTELTRTVTKDIKIGEVLLPSGVLVNLPVLLVHQEEELWGYDAKEFNPERFNEGISKASKGNMSFFSFGWGPRICIASNFAMTEAKLVLSLILQRFSFELSTKYAHAPSAAGTLRPQFGVPIKFHRL